MLSPKRPTTASPLSRSAITSSSQFHDIKEDEFNELDKITATSIPDISVTGSSETLKSIKRRNQTMSATASSNGFVNTLASSMGSLNLGHHGASIGDLRSEKSQKSLVDRDFITGIHQGVEKNVFKPFSIQQSQPQMQSQQLQQRPMTAAVDGSMSKLNGSQYLDVNDGKMKRKPGVLKSASTARDGTEGIVGSVGQSISFQDPLSMDQPTTSLSKSNNEPLAQPSTQFKHVKQAVTPVTSRRHVSETLFQWKALGNSIAGISDSFNEAHNSSSSWDYRCSENFSKLTNALLDEEVEESGEETDYEELKKGKKKENKIGKIVAEDKTHLDHIDKTPSTKSTSGKRVQISERPVESAPSSQQTVKDSTDSLSTSQGTIKRFGPGAKRRPKTAPPKTASSGNSPRPVASSSNSERPKTPTKIPHSSRPGSSAHHHEYCFNATPIVGHFRTTSAKPNKVTSSITDGHTGHYAAASTTMMTSTISPLTTTNTKSLPLPVSQPPVTLVKRQRSAQGKTNRGKFLWEITVGAEMAEMLWDEWKDRRRRFVWKQQQKQQQVQLNKEKEANKSKNGSSKLNSTNGDFESSGGSLLSRPTTANTGLESNVESEQTTEAAHYKLGHVSLGSAVEAVNLLSKLKPHPGQTGFRTMDASLATSQLTSTNLDILESKFSDLKQDGTLDKKASLPRDFYEVVYNESKIVETHRQQRQEQTQVMSTNDIESIHLERYNTTMNGLMKGLVPTDTHKRIGIERIQDTSETIKGRPQTAFALGERERLERGRGFVDEQSQRSKMRHQNRITSLKEKNAKMNGSSISNTNNNLVTPTRPATAYKFNNILAMQQ